MPRSLKILLAIIAGLVVGEGASIGYYILATNYFGVFDRDGGGAMGAIFILGPFLALVCAVVFGVIAARRTRTA